MTISVENLPVNIDNYLLQSLEQLSDYAHSTIMLIESKKPCDDVFDEFTKITKTINNIESLLLTSHLKNCLFSNIPYMGELLTTLQNLSTKGYGALIVIERKDNIEKMINRNNLGILIDAKISTQLLENIFFPGTPLHDGAVVIRKERIFSAGCVLPLSKQIITGKKFGTRHRAALGLSEIGDAIIIVVSEETKKISIAFKGELLLIEKISSLSEFITH